MSQPLQKEENSGPPEIQELVSRILKITSPDDLAIATLANEIKSLVDNEEDLRNLVSQLCDCALSQIEHCGVIGAIFGLAGSHQAGSLKLRPILFQRVQRDYSKREELLSTDRTRFVTSAMFLGEIFFYCKSDKGTSFKVLAEPVVTYLSMIMKPHLSTDPGTDIDEEMVVVSKQLLQNGRTLYQLVPKAIEDILRDVTEIIVRHPLSDVCKLNLLAALGELWPEVNESLNPRTVHASLAARIGLSLKI